ncbi:MAG: DEAD/DEAH box helicase [Aestuariivirga sp.]
MSNLLRLRPYQEEAVEALYSKWAEGLQRLAVVLPTGAGKTTVFTHLAERFLAANPSKRVLVLAHTDELVRQAAKQMRKVAPHRTVGIVKATRNEVAARVIVASVQSLRNSARRGQLRNIGLVICDEVHHCPATTYRAIFEHYGCMTGDTPLAGFTATLARGDKSKISDIIQDVAYRKSISWAIRRGYLLDVRGKRIVIPEMNLLNVKKSRGDFSDGSLAEELERSLAPEKVAEAYAEHASGRKGIAFWPTVEIAEHGAEAFNACGIRSETIHGKLDAATRRGMLTRLASGETQVVHGVAVLTEGFDDPTISCVVMARPTRSAPLYQQCVGRGLRPNLTLPVAERGDCLVLDVVGASRTHDLRSLVDLSEREIREDVGMDEELSLIDMEDMQEEQERGQGVRPEDDPYSGEISAEEFDPLGRTTSGAWLTTFGGTYFLPAGKTHFVLLVPSEEPGAYDVAWLAKDCRAGGDVTEHRELSLEMATSWAEEVVEEKAGEGLVLSSAKARWRKADPSPAQKGWATRNGLDVTGLTKGEVSDLRTMMEASERIDPVIDLLLSAR